jgi:hypothetical protein
VRARRSELHRPQARARLHDGIRRRGGRAELNIPYLLGYVGSGQFRTFGKSDEKYHVRRGNDLVAARLASLVASQATTGSELVAVALNAGVPRTPGARAAGDERDPRRLHGWRARRELRRARQFLAQLEPVIPGATRAWTGRATIDSWTGDEWTLGSYSFWKVGQYQRFAGSEREQSGACHFAGEHTSGDFQGYLNGAVESG